MARKKSPPRYVQPYRYPSPNIPMSAIRRFARQIALRFHPEKIILFGSYAYGTPHEESDVDLLVIMPARNVIDQSVRIELAIDRPFALDLIVRTPNQIKRGLQPDDCDWFLREIIEKGKVLYEAPHRAVGSQGRGRLRGRHTSNGDGSALAKRRLLSLSAGGGKILESTASRTRSSRSVHARSRRSP
jgi:predicted nucleotidyltransferase